MKIELNELFCCYCRYFMVVFCQGTTGILLSSALIISHCSRNTFTIHRSHSDGVKLMTLMCDADIYKQLIQVPITLS